MKTLSEINREVQRQMEKEWNTKNEGNEIRENGIIKNTVFTTIKKLQDEGKLTNGK